MRYSDWPKRLNVYFISVKDMKLDYDKFGEFNCAIFTGGAIEAMTGVDHLSEFTGKYTNKKEANAVLKTIGNGSLLKTIRKKFGHPVNGASGKRGDIAWYNGACGIIIGRDGIFLTEEGYGTVAISRIKWAFRVPFE